MWGQQICFQMSVHSDNHDVHEWTAAQLCSADSTYRLISFSLHCCGCTVITSAANYMIAQLFGYSKTTQWSFLLLQECWRLGEDHHWAKLTALITLIVLLHLETVTQTKMQIYSNNFLNALAFFVFSRSVIGLGKWTLFNIYSSIACFCARLLMQIFSVTDRQTLSYKTVCFLFNVNHSKMNTVKLKWSCNTAEETEGNTMWRTNQRANCVVS